MGQLAIGQNRLDEVAKYADELSKTPDGRLLGRSFGGYLALAQGQTEEAIKTLQDVVQRAPTLAPAYYYLGIAYLAQQNPLAAKTAFTEVLRLAPN